MRRADAPTAPPPPRFALWPVLGVAAAVLVVLMLVAARYGYHRDELYLVAASKRLAWGYVDQPPLSVALVWLARHLFGNSLVGLRLFPALSFVAAVVLTGLIARELGGRRFAQTFAALTLAVSPFLIAAHMAGPTVYDLALWALAILIVLRILRTADQRLWLLVGLVVGVSLFAKHTVLLLVIGLLVGFVASRQWKVLLSPYLWAAGGLAVLIWMPNLLWQAGHGWPALEMSGSLQEDHSGVGESLAFPLIQVLLPGVWAAPVWLAGLWALWKEERFRPYRAFSAAYVVLFCFLIVAIGDRPYYLGPLYTVLLAAGALVTEGVVEGSRRFFSSRPPQRRYIWRSARAAVVWVVVWAIVLLPMSLPVLPARVLATVPLQAINYNLGEEHGWPELAQTVAGVYEGLPPDERDTTAIVTVNYGEAGAIDRYGPALGLPLAHSGQNNYWWWGPPPAATTTTIAVGWDDSRWLERYFANVEQVATVDNAAGVDNDEDGIPVWLCRGASRFWPDMWPDFRHYD